MDKIEPGKKRHRPRKFKARPTDIAELLTAIDDGKLDGRTAPAKRITALRSAIAAAPFESAQGVVRDILAVNLTIAQAITAEIGRPGFQVLLPGGKLNPLLVEHWPDVQRSLLNSAQILARMLEKEAAQSAVSGALKGASGEIKDLTALVLEASADEIPNSYPSGAIKPA